MEAKVAGRPAKWVEYRWPKAPELKEFACGNVTFTRQASGVLSLLDYQVAECEPALLAAGFEKISAPAEDAAKK